MAAAIVFDRAAWIALYPEFAALTAPQAQNYFDIATYYLRNDGTSPIPTTAMATTLLYLLTAHVAWLFAPRDASGRISATGATPELVGRISSATEGSVTVQTEYITATSASMAWYVQTKYGVAYWQLIAPYRTFRYRPGPQMLVPPSWPAHWPSY